MSSAKQEILARIRESVRGARDLKDAEIPRGYRQTGALSRDERIELLSDPLRDYGCGVHPSTEQQIAANIGYVLQERNKNRILITPDVPHDWLPSDREFLSDDELSYEALDRVPGVLTRCALAIAATGTIVLRHSAETGRRALTLIPDYHLCIVFAEQIVELVPEAFRRMAEMVPAPLTTISGPSATSDIEMTRIQGVHGPRTLDVLIVR